MTELKINPVFRDKIPPLSKEEFERLEENILSDGIVREPLVVWNGTIIDGHHRYAIIKKHHEIPYTIREMEFSDEWAAISWMCANQLGRRNITDEQKTYLLGKLYEARKNTKGGDRGTAKDETGKFTAKGQNGPLPFNSTAQRIANEQGVGEKTVKRAEHFAKGLDAAEEVSEGFREKVLSGEIKATKNEIAALRTINNEERSKAVEAIKKQDKPSKPKPERRYRPKEVIEKEKAGLRFTDKVVNEILSKTETEEYTLDDFTEEFSCIAADTVSRLRRMVSIRNRLVSDNAAEVTKLFFDLTEKIEKITEAF